MLEFTDIDLNKQKEYNALLKKYQICCSDYSFINLWGWGKEYNLKWAWKDDVVWIKQAGDEDTYWAPITDYENSDWTKIFDGVIKNPGEKIIRINEELANILIEKSKYDFEKIESREHWDYLYSVQELIELKGKRFHKKKNLLNQFLKYNFKYFEISDGVLDEIKHAQRQWCEWKDCCTSGSLKAENRVIVNVLDNWNNLENISGGAIEIDGKVVAFTIAETFTNESVIIHFEKGLPDYKGVYQAINQFYLENNPGFKISNREQDLGDEGLRKSKLSYNPIDFNKKCTLVLK